MKIQATITLIEGEVFQNVDEHNETPFELADFYAKLLGSGNGKKLTITDDLTQSCVAVNPDYVSHISFKEVK